MKKIINILIIQWLLVVAFILLAIYTFGQTNGSTVRTAANTEYNKASGFKRLVWGDHYRKEWATAVDVPVLNMDEFAGGLTPLKMGGGMQTKSLRLNGADGKEYVLRSVNKDPSKAIVTELRGTFAEDVVQDQISSSNPYAPMVVASLADAAGIYHNNPQIVYVPKSSRLGEFENTFANTLCLLEERPSGNQGSNANYGYANNIVNSEKLFEKILSNSDHQVDGKAFLKARLFDILIGDWDRHEDQWLWASFKQDDKTIYKPIPRDRDQAFSSLDGIIPHLATQKWAMRNLQNFDYCIKDVNGLATSGNSLDRMFTTQLTLSDWIKVAEELQSEITDKAITVAFGKMPAAIYTISGKETIAKLKKRRDDLKTYAVRYYKFLSEQVNITGTKDKEFFEVKRINDDSTLVIVYKTDDNGRVGRVVFQRTFLRNETKEIRLYGLDGNDEFNVKGKTDKGITVRMIGGNGEDRFTDRSSVAGLSQKTKVYDDENNKFVTTSETSKFISTDTLKNKYNRKSFKYDWFAPVSRPGYNPDDGLYVGGGVVFKKQQYGKAPYGYMQSIGAQYAFQTGAYTFSYQGIFKEVVGKWDLQFDANINAPNYSRNYFGLGNETERLDDADRNYYRVRFNEVLATSSFKRQINEKHSIDIGLGFQSIKMENNDGRFISTSNAKLDSVDFERKNYGTAHINYQFNTLNDKIYPTKGIRFSSGVVFTQNVKEDEKRFLQLSSEVSTYASLGQLTLATRTGIATNIGDEYEFFQANTLSGSTNVRGYRRDRFTGKTSVYHNTELRWAIGEMNAYFVKGKWGLLGFFDNGRVWMPGEESNKWHNGYGGGVWFIPFNAMSFTATYGASKEDKIISVAAGFLF